MANHSTLRRTAILPFLAILSGCPSAPSDYETGLLRGSSQTTVQKLRLSTSAADWPSVRLHWNATRTGDAPRSFRVFQGPEPLTDANRNAYLVAELPGTTTSVALPIPRRGGLRYLAVQAVEADGELGSPSKILPVDTTDRIAFHVLNGSAQSVWVTNDNGTADEVFADAKNLAWTPGSRALTAVRPGPILSSGFAQSYRHSIWQGRIGDNAQPAPSLPPQTISSDWYSMRVAVTGDLAYRRLTATGSQLSVQLFARSPAGEVRRLSQGSDEVLQFAWSPNGAHILFLQGRAGGTDRRAFVVAADGSDLTEISGPMTADDYALSGHWSADSERIALHIANTANSRQSQLRLYHVPSKSSELNATTSHESSWEGNTIFYTRPVGSDGTALTMYTMGSAVLPKDLAIVTGSIFQIRIAPDGKNLVFFHAQSGGPRTASVLALDSLTQRPLTLPSGMSPLRSAWSPNGRMLAISTLAPAGTNAELRVFDVVTSVTASQTWLTGSRIGYFAWSPFENELAAIVGTTSDRLMRADGSRTWEVSVDVPPRLFVSDFVWSNWGLPRSRGVFSTLVSK